MKVMREYQIILAGQRKTPLEKIDPPLNEEEKKRYYSVMEYTERIRKETGKEPMFYIPADSAEDEDYIEDIYSDDFDKSISEALNKREKEKSKKERKTGKKKKSK